MVKRCEYCEGDFTTKDGRQRYCNHSCAAIANNTRRGRKIKERYKNVVQRWLDGEHTGTTKAGLSEAVRKYLIEEAGYKCSGCKWSGFNPVSGKSTLQVDHIDGNCFNNKRENLKVLCPNCHSLTPTYGGLNKGHGRKFRYSSVV